MCVPLKEENTSGFCEPAPVQGEESWEFATCKVIPASEGGFLTTGPQGKFQG